jgi:hypothetical protein
MPTRSCRAAEPGGVLTADPYQRIGEVAGVLTREADKVAAELGGAAGPVLSTLVKFVTIGENEPNGDGGDAILEVAHEALFRHWALLRHAIEACTDQLRWRADLKRWAKDWDSSGRQDAYLFRDERLKAAQHRAASDSAVVDGLALVAEFLAYSNQADRATMQRPSETIVRQALGTVDRDPDYSLLLALAAFEECAPTALALRALTRCAGRLPGACRSPWPQRWGSPGRVVAGWSAAGHRVKILLVNS